MAQNFVLTEQAAKKLGQMSRWFDLHGNSILGDKYRRRGGFSAVEGTEVRRARTTAAAGAAATIVCNLLDSKDVEITSGNEAGVTVYCDICGGGNLNSAWPHLANDQDIVVFKHNDKWRCLWGFQKISVCA
jgi:hypothetical protein